MLKKKWFWILIIVIVLVAGGGGYYYYSNSLRTTTRATGTQAPAMQTAVARLGDITLSATGTGQVVPVSEITLGFNDPGTLIEVNVAVGDKVKKGQVLARLQTKDTAETIAASIAAAELNVIKAQNALADLNITAETSKSQALTNIATYEQSVRDAQYNLANYAPPISLQGLSPAEAVDKTRKALEAATQAFEPYKYLREYDPTRVTYLTNLNYAQSDYDAAVKWLGLEYTLETAQSNLKQAQLQYEKYKNGPSVEDVAAAEGDLTNAQAQLALAKQAVSIEDLVAPIDGTVMTVATNVGGVVGTSGASAVFTLADLSQSVLTVYLDETDLNNIAVGYKTNVTFDALPERTFTGKVVLVNPGLETVSNVQAIKIQVLLDKVDPQVNLPVGLNASVDVIAGSATNAVLVPIVALHELAPGEFAVFVVINGVPTLRPVKVGLQDVTNAEILSGLQAGDIVSTGIIKTQ
jgi:RND family efflux transporter MFP subunit